jgi:hypothetical protein
MLPFIKINGMSLLLVGSKSGQKQSVNFLQNMVYSTIRWCGVAQSWCGVAQLWCGVAQLWCGVAQLWCGMAQLWCGVAQFMVWHVSVKSVTWLSYGAAWLSYGAA